MIRDQIIWVEKWRPHKVKDCILPESLKQIFQAYVNKKIIPHMTLAGTTGCGKTTIARCLCEELDADWFYVNCSENGNIDTLRTDIRGFSSTISMTGGRKVVILDEADGLTGTTQQALRGFIEEFSGNASFILTCNFKNQIIEPILGRCPIIDFKPTKTDKPAMAKAMHQRCVEILKKENIPFDEKVLAQLILKFFPDFRQTLGVLQKYSIVGKIDEGILNTFADSNIKSLIEAMKVKDFTKVRRWVADNVDNEPTRIYRLLFDSMLNYFESSFIPQFVLMLGDALDQASRSLDQEVCLLAFLTRTMADEDFKIK